MAVLLNNNTISIYYGTKRIIIDDGGGSFTETDPTVPAWAKAATKPTYTASEVGALPNTTTIPAALSDLTDDSTHRVVTDNEKATWNGKQNAISDLAAIRQGAALGASAVQTEQDPVFSNSPAANITSANIVDWNNKSTFSGNYNDLTNKPNIPINLSDLNSDSSHRTVSDTEKSTWNSKSDFSGSYNDLSDKPTIPAAQVNSDWNASTGLAAILHKPSIPINLSDLNDDSTHRLVTDAEKNTWNNKQAAISDLATIRSGAQAGATAYQKPATGIPPSDLQSGTIPTVPTNVSAFTNDANYISQDDVISVYSGSSAPSSSLGQNGDIYIQTS